MRLSLFSSLHNILFIVIVTSITEVESERQKKVPRCENFTSTDFRFTDITPSSANISWISPSSISTNNTSVVSKYIINYRGKYRQITDVGGEKNVSANQPMWFEVTGLSPWPTQYQVCLQIEYMENGNTALVNGERGCGILCTKLDHFDYFAIGAIASAGLILLVLLVSFICSMKWDDPYGMSKDEVAEMNMVKKVKVKKRKQRRVGYADFVDN